LIDGKSWRSWVLDGKSNGNINQFKGKYKEVLWAILEGRCTLFIYAEDISTNELTPVGAFNLISGALSPEQIKFSDSTNLKTFESFNEIDSDFYNEDVDHNIVSVMKYFKMQPLFAIPRKDRSTSDWYNFLL
jgi:hypothetical protein